MVETLLKVQPEGVTSLHLAARNGSVYSAKVLIDAGADLNARDSSMRTPLHVSVLGKSTNIMKLLMDAGCDVKAVNDRGFSVLHIAALSGNEKAVQELRMAGIETDEKDSMGLMPEDVADVWGSHGTAWLLRKMPKATRNTKITTANSSSSTMVVGLALGSIGNNYSQLMTQQFRLSYGDYEAEGQKTLKWAKMEGMAFMLEANVPKNRDPHYQDEAGFTALHWAAQLGRTSTVRALSKSCCSYASAVTIAGDTPAQLAEEARYTQLAQELSAMAAMKTQQEDHLPVELYWKLLITISTSDDVGEAGKLLSSGAPLHATKDLHTDAMVLAITCNRPRIVTLLAAAGAPLTTISGNLSLLQLAWLIPDVTIRVKVLITRVNFCHS
ncbi:Serine/threonine-protein phosphatase 6 regulatory ankyrin repeat subunit C [Portunus trituberculatus]|uniref:Serine/threonine-protein phosphatase 6 regulatory ankyrin repeat subunit C n=1 Tax=Portunus trituberculatus TaxID=210409 RepID=A0A5B7HRW5_PORTR|nr:Serine/threonine-protein phosphatase 6 regulatory ankyrin repeat subunit C [Portunus trituberculatus]